MQWSAPHHPRQRIGTRAIDSVSREFLRATTASRSRSPDPRFHPTTRAAKQHDALAGTNRAGKNTCIECLLDLRHVMARIQ